MIGLARTVIAVSGAVLVALGLFLALPEDLPLAGISVGLIGAILIVAIALERMRYHGPGNETMPEGRSSGAEEPRAALDPRFRPTDEVYIDPTSGQRVRVYMDPTDGERRYRAEG